MINKLTETLTDILSDETGISKEKLQVITQEILGTFQVLQSQILSTDPAVQQAGIEGAMKLKASLETQMVELQANLGKEPEEIEA